MNPFRPPATYHTLDLHAAGEPCRVLYSDCYDMPGESMRKRLDFMKEQNDPIRVLLMQEPRGHKAMFGSVLCRPVTDDADVGILYMDTGGYLDMCIHGTICSARAVDELGLPLHTPDVVKLDAVCGRIEAHLHRGENGRVKEVTVQNVPSFVFTPEPVLLDVEGYGPLPGYVVFAGNFFVVVKNPFPEPISPKSHSKDFYVNFGMRVRAAANKAVSVAHPTNPSTRTIALTVIYEELADAPLHVRNTVVFGDGQMDRSPCGSGTSALMTLMHHLGKLDVGAPYISESFIGSVFNGLLKEETLVGPYRAVVPLVRGQANLMARCEFYREEADPFPNGFVVD